MEIVSSMPRSFVLILVCSILHSTISLSQWQQKTNTPTDINSMMYANNALYIATPFHVYQSTDEGDTWIPCDSGIVKDTFNRVRANNLCSTVSSLFVSTMVDSGGVYRSTDNGQTWSMVLNGKFIQSFVTAPHALYAFDTRTLLKSTDDGVHWAQTTDSLPVTMACAANDSFMFCSGVSGVWRSSNDGQTWQQTALNNDFIISLLATDSVLFAGSDFGGVHSSTDNGAHWLHGNTDSLFNTSFYIHDSMAFVGTDHGIYRSGDGGAHWNYFGLLLHTETGLSVVSSIAASSNTLFTINSNGTQLWASPLASALEVTNQPETPAQLQLKQNYPNPFNPSTELTYSLRTAGFVTLSIYNLLGEEIVQLVHGYQAAGFKTIQFHADHLPSGIYFYRLSTDNKTLSKKMLLLR